MVRMTIGCMLLVGLVLPAAGTAAPPADLDARVAEAMQAFDQPGTAIAIVEGGETTLARGYGTTEIGEGQPVTADTLFNIASVTKASTATALAILVDEGRVEWDAPVRQYLPEFAMADPYLTEHMTVRDLLVHRSGLGLGGGDLLIWPSTDFTRAEIVERLRHVPLETGFRSGYAYDNLLYIVAGELIGRVSGMAYEDFVGTRIFAPLGMTNSYPSRIEAGEQGGRAVAHARNSGSVRGLGPQVAIGLPPAVANTAPSGGIVTSAADFAHWLRTVAAGGVIEGERRLYSADQARELWRARTIIFADPRPGDDPEETHFALYALGWEVDDYRGHPIVWHAGSLAGMTAIAMVIPEADTAFAVFMNGEEGMAMRTIRNTLLDHYLGLQPVDWLADGQAIQARIEAQLADADTQAPREAGERAPPPLALAAYAGTYRDPWYGDVVVTEAGDGLRIAFSRSPSLSGPLEPWDGATFRTRFAGVEDAFVSFASDPATGAMRATLRAVSPLADFSYDYDDLRLQRVDDAH